MPCHQLDRRPYLQCRQWQNLSFIILLLDVEGPYPSCRDPVPNTYAKPLDEIYLLLSIDCNPLASDYLAVFLVALSWPISDIQDIDDDDLTSQIA